MDTHFAVLPLDVVDTLVSHFPDGTQRRPPRFLRLPHPRTGIASLFLAHEAVPNEDEPGQKRVSKILEVQAVEPPNARSWFNGDEVVSDGKLVVMTPVDPLFLLIPILGAIKQPDGSCSSFRPAEDIFEEAARWIAETCTTGQDTSASVGVEDVLGFAALDCTKKTLERLCDVKEITADITVFRYSSAKLMQALRSKVAVLSAPRVMEMSRSLVRSLAKDGLMEDRHEDLLELARTKLACEMLGQYLAPDIREELVATYDLSRLDAHMAGLAKARGDGGGASKPEGAAVTKRKRDGKGSRGVEKLKRVNVGGMSKLSAYFGK